MIQEQLPYEIIDKVLRDMDARSKRNLRQASTTLFDIIDYRNFAIYFARSKQLPKMVTVFSRYQKPIGLTFTKTINLKPKAINYLSKLTNITSLSFDIYATYKDQKHLTGLAQLTNLQQLTFSSPISYCDSKILASLDKLTKLEMVSSSEDWKVFSSKFSLLDVDLDDADNSIIETIQNIGHLTSLKIETFCLRDDNFPALANASNLKSLQLGCRDLSTFNANPNSVDIGTLTNLEQLCLKYYTVTQLERCVGLTSLFLHQRVPHSYTSSLTVLTNLKTLDISFLDNPEVPDALPDLLFLTALSNLTEFKLDTYLPLGTVLDLLPQSLTSLELKGMDLNVGGISWLVNLNELILRNINIIPDINNTVSAYFLTDLVNLTNLELSSTSINPSTLTCITCLYSLKVFKGSIHYVVTKYADIDYSQLPNLENLSVPIISKENFQSLSNCTKLTKIDAKNGLKKTSDITKLPLRVLHCSSEENDEFWQHLVHLTNLESLRVGMESSTKSKIIQSQEAKIASLTVFKYLTNLEFHRSSKFNIKCIAHLTSLQRLFLSPQLSYPQCLKLKKIMPFLHSIISPADMY